MNKTKNKRFFLPFIFFILQIFFLPILKVESKILVMPEQYAYVVANNTSDGYNDAWGDIEKWRKIVLWGRYEGNKGRYYRWRYKGSTENWKEIKDKKFLKSNEITFNITSGKSIEYYPAVLEVATAQNEKSIIEAAPLLVKAVNLGQFERENGAVLKNKIVRNIAKGKGLTYLYLTQKSDGSWDLFIRGGTHAETNYSISGTSLALYPFLIYNHSIYDPYGERDVFTKCVDDGIRYLLLKANILDYEDSNSSLNNDNKMISIYIPNAPYTLMYEHGFAMFTFSVCENIIRRTDAKIGDLYPTLSNKYGNMTFKQFIENLVEFASYAQSDSGPWQGGWRYEPNSADGDLSVIQIILLGLTTIEQNWNISARSFVREKLVDYVKKAQYVGKSYYSYGVWNKYYDGAGYYSNFRDEEHPNGVIYYGYPDEPEPLPSNTSKNGTDAGSFLVGTSGLLQIMYYLSLDTTIDKVCGCGSNECKNKTTDYKLYCNWNGCHNVKRAINFLGRALCNGIESPDNSTTYGIQPATYSYYTMFCITKVLRFYNYIENGVNNGYLRKENNFDAPKPVSPSTGAISWEEQFINTVLSDMAVDYTTGSGYWIDGFERAYGSVTATMGTALALIIISEEAFNPLSEGRDTIDTKLQPLKDFTITKTCEKENK